MRTSLCDESHRLMSPRVRRSFSPTTPATAAPIAAQSGPKRQSCAAHTPRLSACSARGQPRSSAPTASCSGTVTRAPLRAPAA
eukprot:5308634-Prymnesium_polylepis.3